MIHNNAVSVNKVSAVRLREAKGRLSYKRGGRELKGKVRVRVQKREGKIPQPSVSSLSLTYLKYSYWSKLIYLLFHVWTEDMFLFSALPVFVNTERHLKVVVTSTSMR